MGWLAAAWPLLQRFPAALKYLPTALRYLPQILAIVRQAKDLARQVEKETGVRLGSALKDVLGKAAENIPKPRKMTREEEELWFRRMTPPDQNP